MGKRLVGVEKAVAAGEQVALHHSHQRVLAQHLHHPAAAGELAAVEILRQEILHPHLFALLVDRLQTIGSGFIRTEHPQRIGVKADGVAQQFAEHRSVFVLHAAWPRHCYCVVGHGGQLQLVAQ